MSTPETTDLNSGGSSLSNSFNMNSIAPPRPSTASSTPVRRHNNTNTRRPQSSSPVRRSSKHKRRPSTAIAKTSSSPSTSAKGRQWPKQQHFRSWRQQRKHQLSALRTRPLPPSSPQEERIARETWRDIDISQLDASPLRAVSSETILMQHSIQQCLTDLAAAPYGKSQLLFAKLANLTSTCFKGMERNLASVSEETTSVDVAQQTMHALSHSTLLQRVWKETEYYVSSVADRAAVTKMQHDQELQTVTNTLQTRILELEKQVQNLTPDLLPEDDDEDDEGDEADNNGNNMSGRNVGIVGRYTLDARDRNKRRQYSHTDLKLEKISSDLMKWHNEDVAKNQLSDTRLELRQKAAARESQRIKSGGGVGEQDTLVVMTPAARHKTVANFMQMIHKVDEHARALMLEELFMSFKGHHRVEAMAGMLIQVSSKNRLLLMTDMHNEMKETDKRRFLKFTMKECDEELAQMLFEKLCDKLPIERRRQLLHEQVDTLGTEQMMKIIQELIAESIGEASRMKLVDGLTSYLSPMEKRECIVNIVFGITIVDGGHGYLFGDTIKLIQHEGDGTLTVNVTGVQDGKLTDVALVSLGKGYVAGKATEERTGGGATFILTPSSRTARQNILSRLSIVMPKLQQLMSPAGSPSGSPRGF